MRLPQGWEWLIIALLVVVLFGAKRLPDAARGLGRSLRIFKAETKGLVDETKDAAKAGAADPAVAAPAPQVAPAAPPAPALSPAPPNTNAAAPPAAAPPTAAAPAPEHAEG